MKPKRVSTSQLTNNSALITVNKSRSGDVFFDNIEANHGGRGIRAVGEIADTEQDLPRHQVREQRGRRRKQRVLRQERPHARTEGLAFVSGERRRRKRQEVVEIRRHSPLHPLQRLPSTDYHYGGAWS